MITITLPDGTKIHGDKDEVLDAYLQLTHIDITPILPKLPDGYPELPDDYPMPKVPWEPEITWTSR